MKKVLLVLFIYFITLGQLQAQPSPDRHDFSFEKPSFFSRARDSINWLFSKGTTVESWDDAKWGQKANLGQDDIELNYPFTVTEQYDYTQAFLLGLDLDSYFQYASDCTDTFILFLDDTAYLGNNVTLRLVAWDPILNFTHMLEGNFSDSVVYCYQFGFSVFGKSVQKFQDFGSFGDYIIGFIFNQMGNAMAFKNIFDDIAEDRAAGYATDIAYQYGRLLRKMFDFQPLAEIADSKDTSELLYEQFQKMMERFAKESQEEAQEEEEATLDALIKNRKENKKKQKKEVTSLDEALAIRAEQMPQKVQDRVERKQQRRAKIDDRINWKKTLRGWDQPTSFDEFFDFPEVNQTKIVPPFNFRPVWYTLYIINGLFQGSIDVFPEESLIFLCKENTTGSFDNGEVTGEYIQLAFANSSAKADGEFAIDEVEESWVTALEGFTGVLGNIYGMAFSCYFSYDVIADPETYSEVFSLISIFQNILYGLGYIISNVQSILTLEEIEGYIYYYKQGYQSGNSLIRIFYTPPAELNE